MDEILGFGKNFADLFHSLRLVEEDLGYSLTYSRTDELFSLREGNIKILVKNECHVVIPPPPIK